MPLMSRLIEGCGYNSEAHLAAFNLRNMAVVLERKKITIYNAENEAEAKAIMDWLKNMIKTSD
jgi:ArsR family metal-binding transcriptional regulator